MEIAQVCNVRESFGITHPSTTQVKKLRSRETLNTAMVMIWPDSPWSPWQVWTTPITFPTIHLTVNAAPRPTVSIQLASCRRLLKFGISRRFFSQTCVMCVQVARLDSWAPQSPAAANQTLSSTQCQVSMQANLVSAFWSYGTVEIRRGKRLAVLTEVHIKTEDGDCRIKRPRGRPPKVNRGHSSRIYDNPKKSKHGTLSTLQLVFLLRSRMPLYLRVHANTSPTWKKRADLCPFFAAPRGTHLWEFIRDILIHPENNQGLMKWEDRREGVFKFLKSEAVAQMWGQKKKNTSMTYEKLSRAMRWAPAAHSKPRAHYEGFFFFFLAAR